MTRIPTQSSAEVKRWYNERTILRDCFCGCRYAVERTVRILDSTQSRAKPSTGRIIDRGVYCQDCGEDLD